MNEQSYILNINIVRLNMAMENTIKESYIRFPKKILKIISFVVTNFYCDVKNKAKIIKEILEHQ